MESWLTSSHAFLAFRVLCCRMCAIRGAAAKMITKCMPPLKNLTGMCFLFLNNNKEILKEVWMQSAQSK